MKRPIFYPPCRWLDPNKRNPAGHFFCEDRHCYVKPSESVFSKDFKFTRSFCAPDCPSRAGETRLATF